MILISIDENTIFPLRQNAAAEAIGRMGDTRAVEPLKKALKDEIRNVRSKAAEALGKIKTKKNW